MAPVGASAIGVTRRGFEADARVGPPTTVPIDPLGSPRGPDARLAWLNQSRRKRPSLIHHGGRTISSGSTRWCSSLAQVDDGFVLLEVDSDFETIQHVVFVSKGGDRREIGTVDERTATVVAEAGVSESVRVAHQMSFGGLEVQQAATGRPVHRLDTPNYLSVLAFVDGEVWFGGGYRHPGTHVLNLRHRTVRQVHRSTGSACSPRGRALAFGDPETTRPRVVPIDGGTFEPFEIDQPQLRWWAAPRISPLGGYVLVTDGEVLRVINVHTGQIITQYGAPSFGPVRWESEGVILFGSRLDNGEHGRVLVRLDVRTGTTWRASEIQRVAYKHLVLATTS